MNPFKDIINRTDINKYSIGIKILTLQIGTLRC